MADLLRVISTPDKGDADGEEDIFDSEDEASEEEEEGGPGEEEADEESEADDEEAAAAIDAAVAAARPAGTPGDEVNTLPSPVKSPLTYFEAVLDRLCMPIGMLFSPATVRAATPNPICQTHKPYVKHTAVKSHSLCFKMTLRTHSG